MLVDVTANPALNAFAEAVLGREMVVHSYVRKWEKTEKHGLFRRAYYAHMINTRTYFILSRGYRKYFYEKFFK